MTKSPNIHSEKKLLGETCDFKYGKSLPASSRTPGEHPVFGSNGQVGSHTQSLTQGPTIIIGRKGSFGEVHFSETPCWPIDTTYYIDESSTGENLKWLSYYLQTLGLTNLNRAAAIPGLNREDAYRINIRVPSLAEQGRTASLLESMDALREKRRKSLELLDELTQSIFLDMFGNPGSMTIPWTSKAFSDVITGLRYGTSNKSTSSGFPALRIPNVVSGSLNLKEIKTVPASDAELERLRLEDGDLLFVRSNGNPEYVGRCALFTKESAKTTEYDPDNFIYASYLIRARPDQSQVNPVYVREFMLSHHGRTTLSKKSKTSAGQYNLNGKNLGSIPIPIPPLELQKEFEDKVSQISLQRAKHQAHLAHLDELFSSVQQRAFDGTLWDDPVMTS